MAREYSRERKDYAKDYVPQDNEEFEVDVAPQHYVPRGERRRIGKIARVRVELKRKYNDPMKNLKEMILELKRRVSNARIMQILKEHQFFESKSEKKRIAKRAAIKKHQMEDIEQKIVAGEQINASPGLIKKVKANMKAQSEKLNKKKDRYNNNNQYQDD